MYHDLTGTDIFEVIFLIFVVGGGAAWFLVAALKKD